MADINLKIKSDFAQASKDLKKFGAITEAEAKRVKKFQESFKGESVDKFIDKNRRLGAAYKANKGDASAIIAQQKALERQSISLINKGLDPQDKAVEELNKEYNRLQKEYDKTTAKTKALEDASKLATKALVGIGVAGAAAIASVVASTVELANTGDELAKTSRKIGVGTDALQELSFAAERTGLPANNLSGLFQKLNRNIGDLQAGTGTLTTFLNKSDTALKEQLESTTDSEEAFNLLIDAIAKAPTQFDKAALSQAAFGRAGQDLILFANEGTEGISKLREEAKNYGLISEDVAKKSEDFVDSQRNLKQATTGLRSELAGKLLPTFTNVLNGFASFVSDSEKVKKTMETVTIVLAGLTAGLITFLAITKGAAAINILTAAFKAFNLAVAANPIGFIATVIVAVLIPAIILLIKNWDKVSLLIQEQIELLGQNFKIFASSISTAWTIAINGIKIIFLSLAEVIVVNVLGAIQKFLDVAAKLPFVGEKFAQLSNGVENLKKGFTSLTEEAKQSSIDVINGSIAEREEIKQTAEENIANIKSEFNIRQEELEKSKEENQIAQEEFIILQEEKVEIVEETSQKILDRRSEIEQKWSDEVLKQTGDRLAILEAEKQKNIQEAEAVGADTTLLFRFYENEKTKILTEEAKKRKDEEIAAIEAVRTKYGEYAGQVTGIVNDLFTVQTNNTENEKQSRIKALDQKQLSEEDHAEAVKQIEKDIALEQWEIQKKQLAFQKTASLIEIAINTAVGISKALAQGGILGIATGALVGAAGIAQAAVVLSQPTPAKPTAQTGTPIGGIEIPSSASTRQDNVAVYAQPGERVDVSPRGQKTSQRFTFEVGRKVLFDIVNEGIADGDVRITDENIQKVG